MGYDVIIHRRLLISLNVKYKPNFLAVDVFNIESLNRWTDFHEKRYKCCATGSYKKYTITTWLKSETVTS